MKIAFLSDIHGNLEALQNVMAFLETVQADEQYFLGDAIGYLPNGLEVIDLLQNYDFQCIKGNHEAMLLGEIPIKESNADVYRLNLVADKISNSQLQFIKSWDTEIRFTLNNKLFYLTHGSPLDKLNGYIYPDSDLNILSDNVSDVIITGHTHRPFIKRLAGKIYINAGSVGLPRDVGNLSSVLIYDSDTDVFEIYRIRFDELKIGNENNIHSSVKQCLLRRTENYVGKKIKI